MALERSSSESDGAAPAVTVIVPTYNRPAMVRRAANSVRRQTYDDWELLIVDDASTDDVLAALSPVLSDSRIRLIRRSVNGGASAARNTGLREARGRFVCFLDDDDEFVERKLAHQVPQLESAPADVAGVFGSWFYASRQMDDRPTGKVIDLHREDLLRLDYWALQLGAGLLRRQAVLEVGFDESLPAEEHWDLAVRLLENHRFTRDDIIVLVMHSDASYRLSDQRNLLLGLELAYKKYAPEISRDRRLNAKWRATMAFHALEVDRARARRHAAAAVRLTPSDPRRWYLLGSSFVRSAPRRWLVAGYCRLGGLRHRLRALRSRGAS